MLYTRLNDPGTAFEPERNLKNSVSPSDGDTVAADSAGNVYAAWHAVTSGATNEVGRAVYVTRSMDEGKTFQREGRATSKPTGACGCCGLRAFADSSEAIYIPRNIENGTARAGHSADRDSLPIVRTQWAVARALFIKKPSGSKNS